MKKILLVADEKGWIFERHCKEIQKRLPEFKIGIAYHRQDIPTISNDYDLVYVLDPMPMRYPSASKTIIGLRCEFLYREHPQGAKGLYENGFPGRCVSIKDKCSIFHVVNENLMSVFKDAVTDKPLMLAQHGIDEEVFDLKKMSEPKPVNDVLTVSTAGRGSGNKGFQIVKKACQQINVKFRTTQYDGKRLSKKEMPSFYHGVDVHTCMSQTEGLNNPILEAGSLGVPVVTTDCGAAKEIIRDGENGFIISRNVEALKEALEKLKDKDLRKELGTNLYNDIMANWTWKVRIKDYRNMFNKYFEMKG